MFHVSLLLERDKFKHTTTLILNHDEIINTYIQTSRAEIAKLVYRQAMGWTTKQSGFHSQQEQEIFLFIRVQTDSGPTQWVSGVIYPWIKWLGHKADYSPPFQCRG
jgi:hypothetical protein